MNKAIDEVINTITNSEDYKICIELKEEMNNNLELTNLIKKIKSLQKKYITNPSIELEEELNQLNEELEMIPIYVKYNNHLTKVNEMINKVKEELNDYFDKLLNE